MDVEEPTKGGFTRLITNSLLTGKQKPIGKAVDVMNQFLS